MKDGIAQSRRDVARPSSPAARSQATAPQPHERRQAPRARAACQVMVITMKGPVPARMLDISVTGCCISSHLLPDVAVSARIAIVSHGMELQAEQRWKDGILSGWRFVYSDAEQERLRRLLAPHGRTRTRRADRHFGRAIT